MKHPPHIAVIGAGIAGLACATALQRAGLTVSVFDKSRGAGGRMSTRRGDGWQCDHGAQYFTARDPAFRAEVQRWCEAGSAAPWTPRLVSLPHDLPAAAPTQVEVERFVGTPRMTAPAALLASRLSVATNTTIEQMQSTPDGWQLRLAERGWLPAGASFDGVVLAIPAPQAAVLLQQSAAELAAVASRTAMRGCWAAMLNFDTPVALPFDAAFVQRGPLRWIARDSSKPGRDGAETWLLHASAEWSEDHLEDDAAQVAQLLVDAFAELGGPLPRARTAHRWRYANSQPAGQDGSVWHADLRIGLCGDWLHGGNVEGAWLSGHHLAAQVLASFTTAS